MKNAKLSDISQNQLILEDLDKDLLEKFLNKKVVVFYSIPYEKIIACVVYEGQYKELIDSFYKIKQ